MIFDLQMLSLYLEMLPYMDITHSYFSHNKKAIK